MKPNKKILILFLFAFVSMSAQKEFWGLTSVGGSETINTGHIFKTDFNGTNAQIVHWFDNTQGMRPYGKLFLASNGKLYGTASEGGAVQPNPSNTGGVLFEYDLIFSRYSVVSYFGAGDLTTMLNPRTGVIEADGALYGTASGVGIFKHNLADEVTTQAALVNASYTGSNSFSNFITAELMQASDGLIYGTTKYYSSCPTTTPYLGSIVRFNPENNQFNYIYPFNCTYFDGASPTGALIEGSPGKLYGTTQHGGVYGYEPGLGDGILFEYNIATNTYTKKFDFNGDVTGAFPGPLVKGADNKFYGILGDGGTDPLDPDTGNIVKGSIFRYDPVTNVVTVLYYFSDTSPNIYAQGYTPKGSLLQASNGIFYGINSAGVFRFDPATMSVTIPATSDISYFYPNLSSDLIEICRKPAYTYIEEDSFTFCTEESFTFDIHNTNATSYIWKKDDVALPEQTSGILSLNDLEVSDSGDYTCEMTNECGTTVTMPVHLTVEECMGLDKAIGNKDAIALYPNPAKDALNIKLPENKNFMVKQVYILNTLGQTVYTYNGENSAIDISNFSTGIYIVKMSTDKGDWLGKFIKN
jgi:hypothetical protein